MPSYGQKKRENDGTIFTSWPLNMARVQHEPSWLITRKYEQGQTNTEMHYVRQHKLQLG
jgi:hypothetical protein